MYIVSFNYFFKKQILQRLQNGLQYNILTKIQKDSLTYQMLRNTLEIVQGPIQDKNLLNGLLNCVSQGYGEDELEDELKDEFGFKFQDSIYKPILQKHINPQVDHKDLFNLELQDAIGNIDITNNDINQENDDSLELRILILQLYQNQNLLKDDKYVRIPTRLNFSNFLQESSGENILPLNQQIQQQGNENIQGQKYSQEGREKAEQDEPEQDKAQYDKPQQDRREQDQDQERQQSKINEQEQQESDEQSESQESQESQQSSSQDSQSSSQSESKESKQESKEIHLMQIVQGELNNKFIPNDLRSQLKRYFRQQKGPLKELLAKEESIDKLMSLIKGKYDQTQTKWQKIKNTQVWQKIMGQGKYTKLNSYIFQRQIIRKFWQLVENVLFLEHWKYILSKQKVQQYFNARIKWSKDKKQQYIKHFQFFLTQYQCCIKAKLKISPKGFGKKYITRMNSSVTNTLGQLLLKQSKTSKRNRIKGPFDLQKLNGIVKNVKAMENKGVKFDLLKFIIKIQQKSKYKKKKYKTFRTFNDAVHLSFLISPKFIIYAPSQQLIKLVVIKCIIKIMQKQSTNIKLNQNKSMKQKIIFVTKQDESKKYYANMRLWTIDEIKKYVYSLSYINKEEQIEQLKVNFKNKIDKIYSQELLKQVKKQKRLSLKLNKQLKQQEIHLKAQLPLQNQEIIQQQKSQNLQRQEKIEQQQLQHLRNSQIIQQQKIKKQQDNEYNKIKREVQDISKKQQKRRSVSQIKKSKVKAKFQQKKKAHQIQKEQNQIEEQVDPSYVFTQTQMRHNTTNFQNNQNMDEQKLLDGNNQKLIISNINKDNLSWSNVLN